MPNTPKSNMVNQVKLYRVKLNLTQEALARAVGVSRQAINAIETGKFNPSLETAFRLSKLFGVAIEEIFELVH